MKKRRVSTTRSRKATSSRARKWPIARKKTRTKQERSTGPPPTKLIVVTSGQRPVHEVAGELQQSGFTVDQVLEHINQVTGHASPAAVRRLKKIKDVTDVSPEHPPFSIGPPDAPVS